MATEPKPLKARNHEGPLRAGLIEKIKSRELVPETTFGKAHFGQEICELMKRAFSLSRPTVAACRSTNHRKISAGSDAWWRLSRRMRADRLARPELSRVDFRIRLVHEVITASPQQPLPNRRLMSSLGRRMRVILQPLDTLILASLAITAW